MKKEKRSLITCEKLASITLTDDIDKNEVVGLLVGNAYIGEMLFDYSIDDSPSEEYTVEEVLNMIF